MKGTKKHDRYYLFKSDQHDDDIDGNETNLNQYSISANTNNPIVLCNIQRMSNLLGMELMFGF